MSVTQEAIVSQLDNRSFLKRRTLFDWTWALLVVAGTLYTWNRFAELMDAYEQAILPLTTLSLLALEWLWKPARPRTLGPVPVSPVIMTGEVLREAIAASSITCFMAGP